MTEDRNVNAVIGEYRLERHFRPRNQD